MSESELLTAQKLHEYLCKGRVKHITTLLLKRRTDIIPEVSATDLDIACNVYAITSLNTVQSWIKNEFAVLQNEFSNLCEEAQRVGIKKGSFSDSLCDRFDDVAENISGMVDVYNALVKRTRDQLHLCSSAIIAASTQETGTSIRARFDSLVRDVSAERAVVARELSAVTLARWLVHEGLFNAPIMADDGGVADPSEVFSELRKQLSKCYRDVLGTIFGSAWLTEAQAQRLIIDEFLTCCLHPEAAGNIGEFPPRTLASFVNVFRAEATDISPALVVMYYCLLEMADETLIRNFRAEFPLTPEMEQWTLAMWHIDHGRVPLGIAALRQSGVLYDRVALPLVRNAYVNAPETELFQILNVMCSTPAATPHTVVDALVRVHVLVRAGMLDVAFAYYREMFRDENSPLVQDVRSSPFLSESVLDSFFDAAIKVNLKRTLVLLPFTEPELRALEKHMLSKGMVNDVAALYIAQGKQERVQQLAGSQKKEPVLATLARNMQTTESQQQERLGSLSFTMSMVSAPIDLSQRMTTSSIVLSSKADDTMTDANNGSQANGEVNIGTGTSTILLSMKSPKRTPNRLNLSASVISSNITN